MERNFPFGGAAPVFRVQDMAASLHFYCDGLHFKQAPWGTNEFTCVMRGHAHIYLCHEGQGRGGAWAWVDAKDVTALYEELKGRDVNIVLPPTNYFWALEMHVEDPDGNVLRLASDPLPDQPFSQHIFGN